MKSRAASIMRRVIDMKIRKICKKFGRTGILKCISVDHRGLIDEVVLTELLWDFV